MDTATRNVVDAIVAKKTLARGVVVLDRGLFKLKSALRGANILVVAVRANLTDPETRESLLFHRILITRRPNRFIDDAPVYEYGIVSLKKLKSIDPDPHYENNRTAKLISTALSRHRLWARGAKFLLELEDDGHHRLEELQ